MPIITEIFNLREYGVQVSVAPRIHPYPFHTPSLLSAFSLYHRHLHLNLRLSAFVFFVLSSSMATSLTPCFQPITIVSSATPANRISRIKPPAASASGKWWTPLFGLSSDPDYIHNPETATGESVTGSSDPDNGRSRFAPGCFTEEKAKQLRMKTSEMANFHDIMYHSAIASRLASDVSGRSNR
ncbi:hypothetical protein L1887_11134 [Cichorium endivia]|nr:hypothetical protein L1887_11134 [Cichorium endivia]